LILSDCFRKTLYILESFFRAEQAKREKNPSIRQGK